MKKLERLRMKLSRPYVRKLLVDKQLALTCSISTHSHNYDNVNNVVRFVLLLLLLLLSLLLLLLLS
jgi:hypothetical protein